MFRIGKRKIGNKFPCFIIAECGINHNGNLNIAKKMVDYAKICGADAVKFQTINPSYFKSKKYYKIFKKCEFTFKEWKKLSDYCKKKNIIFFSTPQTIKDLNLLLKLKVPVIKISSDNAIRINFVKECAKTNIPIIMSTGLGDIKKIDKAVQTITKYNKNFVLLHCVSKYPTKKKDINLERIIFLRERYKDRIIGFSDHSTESYVSNIISKFNIKIYERHFTLDNNMDGPDHKFSLIPIEFSCMIKDIRYMEKIIWGLK